MTTFTEATVEDAALAYLESLGWTIAPGAAAAERTDYAADENATQTVLAQAEVLSEGWSG